MIRILVLALAALLQLGAVGLMIHGRERVLAKGVEMKFVVAPVDPTDPFRGRYVSLRFAGTDFKTQEKLPLAIGQPIHALLAVDAEGYASVKALAAEPPKDGAPYVEIRRWWESPDYRNNPENEKYEQCGWRYNLTFPFDRYYMNEKAAPEAERLYREAQRASRNPDSDEMTRDNYLVVRILNGEVVPVELYLNGKTVESQLGGQK
jgi:uncharacterized membrane-anchored protein